ncbi:MAG: helix-turn-helix transcriptional regulator [Slackia sp.]|nr:helix-turn-helix transcriptional regulator [Slackia sp.]
MANRTSASTLCSLYAAVGLVLVFVWSALSDHVFNLRSALPEFLVVNPRVFFLASILALSIVFAIKPKISRTTETTLGILLPLVGSVGTAFIALAPNQNLFPPSMLCVTGLLALGAGYCWFVMSYGLLLARNGSIARIVYCLAAALAMEPIVRVGIESLFEQTMRAGVAMTLPFISMILLWLVRKTVEQETATCGNVVSASGNEPNGALETTACNASSDARLKNESPLRLVANGVKRGAQSRIGKLFVLLFSTALLLATVRSLSPVGTWDAKFDPAPMTSSPELVAFYAACVLLFARFALVKAEDKPELARFQPAFLLIVLTLFASLILIFTQGPQSAVLYTFMVLDDSFAHMLFWAKVACTVKSTPMPSRRVAGLALGVYASASIAWLFLLGDEDTLQAPAMVIAISAIYLLTMVISHTNAERAEEKTDASAGQTADAAEQGGEEPATALADRIAASIEERCLEISSEYKLSPRETEVLVLLAQGRTRVYIQEELVLAENTVKTHIAHIYKKLEVGNRQEMLDLVFGKNEEAQAEAEQEAVEA